MSACLPAIFIPFGMFIMLCFFGLGVVAGNLIGRLQASREFRVWKEKYFDLIMSVGCKYPKESRHETAKRYIYEAENARRFQKVNTVLPYHALRGQ